MHINRNSTNSGFTRLKIGTLSFVLLIVGCSSGSSSNPPAPNDPPVAIDPLIIDGNGGGAAIGDVLTGDYTYSDADGDPEGTSTFRWLRNGAEITGAAAIDYTLTMGDINQSIAFEVTPIAASGDSTGTAVTSYTVCAADGQPPASTVDRYVFAVPSNMPDPLGSNRIFVDVSGPTGTRGTIEVASAMFSQNFIICAASERLELPESVILVGNRSIETKAVSVVADDDISVQVSSLHREFVNGQIVSADSYAAIPADNVGSAYTINSISSNTGQSGFVIVATSNSTANISVMVSDDVDTLQAGQSEFVTLDPGETIQYLSASGGDLSGSSITADQPVAVISFHSFATIPDGVLTGSFLMEHLIADADLGNQYYLDLPDTRSQSTVRIVGLSNNTTVTTSPAQTIPMLNLGDTADLLINTAISISADQPISVMQFSHGEDDDTVASSAPFMYQVPSNAQFASAYQFAAPYDSDNIGSVFASVVVRTVDVGLVQLNGMPVDSMNFNDIDGIYSIGALSIGSHDNLLEKTGSGIGVILYGYGDTPGDASGNGIPNGVGMTLRE